MPVYANDEGKKMVEDAHLHEFLSAYEEISDSPLYFVSAGESPDFICARESGKQVGVELTRSPHDREQALWDRIWGDGTTSAYALMESIHHIAGKKAKKQKQPHWRTPGNTILVIELLDYSFDSLRWTEDSSLAEDFAEYGFEEIWLADYSTTEAHGEVRLIGLYPSDCWGLHFQPGLQGKPYG